MLPNRIVLIIVLLVYHTTTTSPLWRPCYDRYPLTITDRVRYYRLAYVRQKCALSVTLISFRVYHIMYLVITTICVTLLHPPPPNSRYPESTFFTFLIEIARREQIASQLFLRLLPHQWRSLRIPPSLWKTSYEKRISLIMTVTLSWKRVKPPNLPRQRLPNLLA